MSYEMRKSGVVYALTWENRWIVFLLNMRLMEVNWKFKSILPHFTPEKGKNTQTNQKYMFCFKSAGTWRKNNSFCFPLCEIIHLIQVKLVLVPLSRRLWNSVFCCCCCFQRIMGLLLFVCCLGGRLAVTREQVWRLAR